MECFTRKKFNEMDRLAVQEAKIPMLLLMQKAGEALCDEVVRRGFKKVLVVCGDGNNGGDGLAAASYLEVMNGIKVSVVMLEGKMKSEAAQVFWQMVEAAKIDMWIKPNEKELSVLLGCVDCVIDCLYGTGFHGVVQDYPARCIRLINESSCFVISCDVNSGVECDSGRVGGCCIRSDVTISFEALKPAHFLLPAALSATSVKVAKIGIPESIKQRFEKDYRIIDREYVRKHLPIRSKDGHKYQFGKVGIIGGSEQFSGAMRMSIKAALKSGCGLVSAVVPKTIAQRFYDLDEVMVQGDDFTCLSEAGLKMLERCDSLVFGCGLGKDEALLPLLKQLLALGKPMVIDADGLYLYSLLSKEDKAAAPALILTPHFKEFETLLGKKILFEQRLEYAEEFVKENAVTLVLKGMNTLIFGKEKAVVLLGNDGLAKGGSGDALSGLCGGLLSSVKQKEVAAALAVYLHAYAGDLASEQLGKRGMNVQDVISMLPLAFQKVEQ